MSDQTGDKRSPFERAYKAGVYRSGPDFGVAVYAEGARSVGPYLVQMLTPVEMVEMAEHLLVNARLAAQSESSEDTARDRLRQH